MIVLKKVKRFFHLKGTNSEADVKRIIRKTEYDSIVKEFPDISIDNISTLIRIPTFPSLYKWTRTSSSSDWNTMIYDYRKTYVAGHVKNLRFQLLEINTVIFTGLVSLRVLAHDVLRAAP